MNSNPELTYFFNLPISEVSRNISDALRVLYYGSLEGVFGAPMNDRVNLEEVKAIKIPVVLLEPSVVTIDEYNLVYYRKEMSDSLWKIENRESQNELRKLTQRVSLNQEKSSFARRLFNNLMIQPETACPIYFTKYEEKVPHDGYVPMDYYRQFNELFDGYLMRCEQGFPLVRSLFRVQGIEMAERRLARHQECVKPVITYMAKSHRVPESLAQRAS